MERMTFGGGNDEARSNGLDAREYAALADMALDAVRLETLQSFLERVAQRVGRTIEANTVEVLELQPGGQCLLPRAVASSKSGMGRRGPVATDAWEEWARTSPGSVARPIGDEPYRYGYLSVSLAAPRPSGRTGDFVQATARIVASAIDRFNSRQRLALERGAAQILSDALSLEGALPRLLGVFARHLDMHVLEMWRPDETRERLTCTAFFACEPTARTEEMRQRLTPRFFALGEGLPGAAWERREALWASPFTPDNLSRAREARLLGLRCGFGIPILSGAECLGVLTLFSKVLQVPSDALLRSLEHIGRTIGDFMRRVQAEQERAQAEQRLRQEKESFRTLAESIPHMVWTAGPDGQPDYYNHRTVEFVRISLEEIRERPVTWLNAVHPDDRERVDRSWQKARETGTEHRADMRIRRASDGVYVWHAIHTVPVHDAAGRVVRWFGTATDIDERRKAEAEAAKLAAIVEQSQDAILSCDLSGKILSWNLGAERLYGYRAQEVLGTEMPIVVPPERKAELMAILRRLGRGKRVENVETIGLRKDGSPIDVSVTVSPVHDENDRLVAVAAVVRDIGERKRAEEALREIDRQKDQFLAMLGHELRNPLAAIRSAAELVGMAQPGDVDLKAAQGVLDRQALQMSRLVDGLLDVSRIARGKLRMEMAPLEVVQVAREVVTDRAAGIEASGLELRTRLPTEDAWVCGDRVRLVQVLDNLLTNAKNFTPPPGRIELSLSADGSDLVFRLSDTGIGIPPDMRDTIFQPFQQAPQEMTPSTGGLGLGLALVKGIVDLHGGQVEAHSDGVGRGAEIVVRLPQIAPPGERAAPRVEENRPLRLLLVEDNEDAAQVLRAVLSRDGHQVTVAMRGDDALERMRSEHPDVVLCDLGLPGMSGFDVARAARADASIRDIPLVALTGYGRTEDRAQTQEAGFDDHVTKPASLRDLRESLQRVCAKGPRG